MDRINLENFDWGWMEGSSESSVYHKNQTSGKQYPG